MVDSIPDFYTVAPSDLSPLLAFQLYSSIKVDFNSVKYDYNSDGICNNHNEKTYNARHDKFWFNKASDTFLYQSRYIPLLVSNFYVNRNFWMKDLLSKESLTNALAFRKYQNNIYSSFETEIQRVVFKYKLQSTDELYHTIYNTNYFELEQNKIIQPITSAILNHIYSERSNWSCEYYKTNKIYLNKLLKYATSNIDTVKIHTILDNILLG